MAGAFPTTNGVQAQPVLIVPACERNIARFLGSHLGHSKWSGERAGAVTVKWNTCAAAGIVLMIERQVERLAKGAAAMKTPTR